MEWNRCCSSFVVMRVVIVFNDRTDRPTDRMTDHASERPAIPFPISVWIFQHLSGPPSPDRLRVLRLVQNMDGYDSYLPRFNNMNIYATLLVRDRVRNESTSLYLSQSIMELKVLDG